MNKCDEKAIEKCFLNYLDTVNNSKRSNTKKNSIQEKFELYNSLYGMTWTESDLSLRIIEYLKMHRRLLLLATTQVSVDVMSRNPNDNLLPKMYEVWEFFTKDVELEMRPVFCVCRGTCTSILQIVVSYLEGRYGLLAPATRQQITGLLRRGVT